MGGGDEITAFMILGTVGMVGLWMDSKELGRKRRRWKKPHRNGAAKEGFFFYYICGFFFFFFWLRFGSREICEVRQLAQCGSADRQRRALSHLHGTLQGACRHDAALTRPPTHVRHTPQQCCVL